MLKISIMGGHTFKNVGNEDVIEVYELFLIPKHSDFLPRMYRN